MSQTKKCYLTIIRQDNLSLSTLRKSNDKKYTRNSNCTFNRKPKRYVNKVNLDAVKLYFFVIGKSGWLIFGKNEKYSV